MYGAIREYKLGPGMRDELIRKVHAEFAAITNVPGLLTYTVVLPGPADVVTTSIFEHQAAAEASVQQAADPFCATFDSVAEPRVTLGEITVRHVHENAAAGYGVMRRFACKSEHAELISTRVREGLVPILNDMPGFVSFGLLIEPDRDRGGVSLTAFADRAAAEAGNDQSLAWVKANVGGFLTKPPEVLVGEIKLRHVRSRVGAG
jgi:heme-degrading monooxygenase HmoA